MVTPAHPGSRAVAIGWRVACLLAGLLALLVGPPAEGAAESGLTGFVAAHDPSTMVKCGGQYYVFSTGRGILSRSSADKASWVRGPAVFTSPPAWTTNAVPGFGDTFWAPDIAWWSNRYHLYYSVSTWGKQVSAIGLVTSPTLDPGDPAYRWTDHGPVIQSTVGSPYNTIDPAITWDASGNVWMVFGSYWSGIYLVQLDPSSGLRIAPDSPTYRLAHKDAIEAPCIIRRGSYYYLFVNWGSCCAGVKSTYNIRVGRSTSITGPYCDRDDRDLVNGGGTPFLGASGRYVGPGHFALFEENGAQSFTYHYYDAEDWAPQYRDYGRAKMDRQPLSWTSDGWPTSGRD